MSRRLVTARYRARDRVRAARADPLGAALQAATLLVLLVAAVLVVLPLLWLLSAAVRPPGGLTFPPSPVPSEVSATHLVAVVTETAFPTYLRNSVVVSTATVALTVAVATPAGYALSRFDLRHERALMLAVLGVQMIPIVALVTPLYRLFALAGLLDTLAVVVLADTVLVVPIGVWLVKGYFDTLPPELEEAARVGGATRWQAFRVVAPLARPAVAATAIYAFVVSWNQFIIPLTFTSGQELWTFPVGLYEFISRRGVVDWPLLGAASLWAMVPLLVVVAAFQRRLVTGLTGGFGGR